jgi:hypothetical protein
MYDQGSDGASRGPPVSSTRQSHAPPAALPIGSRSAPAPVRFEPPPGAYSAANPSHQDGHAGVQLRPLRAYSLDAPRAHS